MTASVGSARSHKRDVLNLLRPDTPTQFIDVPNEKAYLGRGKYAFCYVREGDVF
jgi:hypothetical protein